MNFLGVDFPLTNMVNKVVGQTVLIVMEHCVLFSLNRIFRLILLHSSPFHILYFPKNVCSAYFDFFWQFHTKHSQKNCCISFICSLVPNTPKSSKVIFVNKKCFLHVRIIFPEIIWNNKRFYLCVNILIHLICFRSFI